MSPFEIRLELLKMARDMLSEDYHAKREMISNKWNVQVDICRNNGTEIPEHPDYPVFPTEAEIIQKASALNDFVSQIPATQETSRKKSS